MAATYRDDPAWIGARQRLVAERDDLSTTDALVVRIIATAEMYAIEQLAESGATC